MAASTEAKTALITAHTSDCDFHGYSALRVFDGPPGRVLKQVKPVYPEEAKRRRIQGRVVVGLLINNKGEVERTCSQGPPLLAASAETAALGWRFRPFVLNNDPEKIKHIVDMLVFDFVLDTK